MSLVNVEASRLFERYVSALPPDVWHRIFGYIDPSTRIELMWELQILVPAFAWIFSNTPGLWTDWVFKGDRKSRQSLATKFAIQLWRDLKKNDENGPPSIDIHVIGRPFSYTGILSLLPTESLPFVRSINIAVERRELDPVRVRLFLERFPSLSHFGVNVSNRVLSVSGLFGPPASSVVFADEDVQDLTRSPNPITLSSLSLTGAALSAESFGNMDLSTLTSLCLTDQVVRGVPLLSLYAILQRTPNIRRLTARAYWLRCILTSHFWDIPHIHFLPTYTSALRHLDLAGDRCEIMGLVNILTDARHSQLQEISIVFFCDASDEHTPTFDEIPSFNTELRSAADEVDIDGNVFRVASKRSPGHPNSVEWNVEWKLVTISQGFWDSDMVEDVREDFIDRMRDNLWRHCPSVLRLTGIDVADLLYEIPQPCRLQTLSLVGNINYLEESIDYIASMHNSLVHLDFVHYRCSPVSPNVSAFSYASCVTDIVNPLPLADPFRVVTVFLCIPVNNFEGEVLATQCLTVELSLYSPDVSLLTFHPVAMGNFI